jgi:hypothetical protein
MGRAIFLPQPLGHSSQRCGLCLFGRVVQAGGYRRSTRVRCRMVNVEIELNFESENETE